MESGMLATAFYEEERMTRLVYAGRRYSGYKRDSDDERFEGLIACGVNAGTVGMSLFRFPGWLRELGRSNLERCFVLNMVSAHVQILSNGTRASDGFASTSIGARRCRRAYPRSGRTPSCSSFR